MADGADLAHIVGNGEQRHRAGKQLALEIGAQSVAHDRNVDPVGDARQLPDLILAKKLRFVDEDAGDRLVGMQTLDHAHKDRRMA